MLYPLIELSPRPPAVGSISKVEVVDEFGKDSTAVRWIGDDLGLGREISDDIVFEVKGEMRITGQVGQPVTRSRGRYSAQIDGMSNR